MISRRTIISGSDGPIFATFSLNESILDADDRTRLLFLISQGTLPWQPNLCKNDKLPLFVALAYQNRMGYHYLNVPINRANDTSISCKKIHELWSSNSRVKRVHLWTGGTTRQNNWRNHSNISGFTGLIFAIFSPYESALSTDDRSVPYFPLCQGTLPW